MGHSSILTLITLIAVVAALSGLLMVYLRQPPVVGYILSGSVLGSSLMGGDGDHSSVRLLAELGVILLLYFVGMELSMRTFKLIWRMVSLIVLGEILLGLLIIIPFWAIKDWPIAWLLLGGFCLSLSSTAVAVKILENEEAEKTRAGRITLAILIAQDLAVAPMLLIVEAMSPSTGKQAETSWWVMGGQIVLAVGILIGLVVFLAKRRKWQIHWLHMAEARPDLLPLVSLAVCFGFAGLSGLIGISPAFGAFVAGLIIGNSRHLKPMRNSAEAVQSVLLMIFFLSVGLLLDIGYVFDHFFLLVGLWLIVTVVKTIGNMLLARLMKLSWADCLTIALVLGQIGEFSFVLAATASESRVINQEIQKLIVALTALSLTSSPLFVQLVRRNRHRAIRHIATAQDLFRLLFFRERRLLKQLQKRWKSQNKI